MRQTGDDSILITMKAQNLGTTIFGTETVICKPDTRSWHYTPDKNDVTDMRWTGKLWILLSPLVAFKQRKRSTIACRIQQGRYLKIWTKFNTQVSKNSIRLIDVAKVWGKTVLITDISTENFKLYAYLQIKKTQY